MPKQISKEQIFKDIVVHGFKSTQEYVFGAFINIFRDEKTRREIKCQLFDSQKGLAYTIKNLDIGATHEILGNLLVSLYSAVPEYFSVPKNQSTSCAIDFFKRVGLTDENFKRYFNKTEVPYIIKNQNSNIDETLQKIAYGGKTKSIITESYARNILTVQHLLERSYLTTSCILCKFKSAGRVI